jgi:hypothetical protein
MDVVATQLQFLKIADAMVGEAALPDWQIGAKAMRKTTFDQADCSFEGNLLRSEQQMNVVWHDYEGVQLEVALAAVVLEGFEEEICVAST